MCPVPNGSLETTLSIHNAQRLDDMYGLLKGPTGHGPWCPKAQQGLSQSFLLPNDPEGMQGDYKGTQNDYKRIQNSYKTQNHYKDELSKWPQRDARCPQNMK